MVLTSIASYASCKFKTPSAIKKADPTKAMVARFMGKPAISPKANPR
nr:hypothetical protein [Gloeotrichia echinulata DEX184]